MNDYTTLDYIMFSIGIICAIASFILLYRLHKLKNNLRNKIKEYQDINKILGENQK